MNAQELQLELMKLASFNDFNGEKVVESLQSHKDLWTSAIMDRPTYKYSRGTKENYEMCIDLIKLRDLPKHWNVDTLFILPAPGKEDELLALSKTWGADESSYIGGEEACNYLGSWGPESNKNDKAILKVWWD
jgi:hypothetical protein